MKQKQLVWLLGGLVVLLGIAYLTGAFSDDAFSTLEVPEVSIPADDVTALTVASGGAEIVLQRQDGRWRLTAPVADRADSAAVAQLLAGLDDLRLASVVSTNPERYSRYGVDDDAGTTLTAGWDGDAQRLVVGNDGRDFQSVYLRLGGDPRVFLTHNRLAVPDALDRWRNRIVLELPVQAVTDVTVSLTGRPFEAHYGAGGWTLTSSAGTAAADSNSVAGWLRRFASLRADAFLDDVPPADVQANATHRIAFTLPGGTAETIWWQAREADVAFTMGGQTYALSTPDRLNTYFPDPETLLKQ